jgi:tetratricopeptide (TPR) repeat protein
MVRHNQALAGLLVVAIVLLAATPAVACNYGKFGLSPGDSSQATVDGVFRGEYSETKGWRVDRWREQASLASQQATDTPGKLSLAWALHMSGQTPQALAIYQGLLKLNPSDYETLCSYATVLQAQRNYTLAKQTLEKAIALKPGFRNRARILATLKLTCLSPN